MYVRVRELLTTEERKQYMQIPSDISEWILSTYFSFSQHDLKIINRHRRDYNRLGFAIQLSILRYSECRFRICRYTNWCKYSRLGTLRSTRRYTI